VCEGLLMHIAKECQSQAGGVLQVPQTNLCFGGFGAPGASPVLHDHPELDGPLRMLWCNSTVS